MINIKMKNLFFRKSFGQLVIFSSLIFILLSLAGGFAVAADKAGAGNNEYVIGRGDQLQIMVWKEQDLSQNMAVRIDGRISMPLIGDVEAAGKTIAVLTRDLEKRFSEVVTDPSVSVMLIQSKSWRYYIVGKINQPGEFPIDFPITVLQAIAKSGGFAEWAKTEDITILRQMDGREKIIKFNYDALTKGNDLAQNINIKPGDTIIIP